MPWVNTPDIILGGRIMSRADLDTEKETVEERGYEDIFAHLINNKDDETGAVYSENELLGEATLLMMAGKRYMAFTSLSPRSGADILVSGSDTSTTAINTTLFYLSHHLGVLRKLDSELRKCFPRLEDIHPNTAENCTSASLSRRSDAALPVGAFQHSPHHRGGRNQGN